LGRTLTVVREARACSYLSCAAGAGVCACRAGSRRAAVRKKVMVRLGFAGILVDNVKLDLISGGTPRLGVWLAENLY